jgi:hypothetical protein
MNIRQTFLGDLLTKSQILGVHLEIKLNRALIVYCIARKGAMSTQLVDKWVGHFSELQPLSVPTNVATYYEHVEWLLKIGYLVETEPSGNEKERGRPTALHDLTTKGCITALAIPRMRGEHLKEFLSHPYVFDQIERIPADQHRPRLSFLALFRIWQEHGVVNALVDYFVREVVRRTLPFIETLEEDQARLLWEGSAMAEIKSFQRRDARHMNRLVSQLHLSR